MRKIISFILISAFIFILCACSQSNDIDYETGSLDSLMDFGGYEFSIMQSDLVESEQERFGYLQSDIMKARIAEISADWNCSIKIVIDGSENLGSVFPTLMAGGYVCEIAYMIGSSNLVSVGAFHPLNDLKDYIDYTNSEKFGSYGILEQGIYDGNLYTVSPALWPGKQIPIGSYGIFAVNENLVKRYGLDDPRDLLENREWTWDTFERILPEYFINDGSVRAKSVNITHSILDFALMNGADYVTVREGRPFSAIDSPEKTETIDWCSDVFSQYSSCISFDDHDTMVPKFLGDQLVMTQTSIDQVIRFMGYTDNIGIVPMPCGPNGEYGKWVSAYSENTCFGILVNAKKPVASARIIDRLCDVWEDYETEDLRKDFYRTYFSDSRDIDLIFSILKNSRWNYEPNADLLEFFDSATEDAGSGRSSAEIFSKYLGKAKQSVEEYIIPNHQFFLQYEKALNE